MFFFYFVLESALLATQCTSHQEYAVRFSQKSNEIFKNIWKFIDFKCDQIHTYYIFNLTKNMFRAQFFRKHEKFFENKISSLTPQFKNKQFIHTRNETQTRSIHNFTLKYFNISHYEKYNNFKITQISMMNSTAVKQSNKDTHAQEISRYENISYLILSYIKKDRKVGFKNSPTFRESDLTQKKISKNLIRIKSQSQSQNLTPSSTPPIITKVPTSSTPPCNNKSANIKYTPYQRIIVTKDNQQ